MDDKQSNFKEKASPQAAEGDRPRGKQPAACGEAGPTSNGALASENSLAYVEGEQCLRLPEGVSNNIPSPITKTIGGEDWLELALYLLHYKFPDWKVIFDQAREAAEEGDIRSAQVQLGDQVFVMQPGSARTGRGKKRISYRWHLRSESGWTLMLMKRAAPHSTMPNGIARATSLPLLRAGVQRFRDELQQALTSASIRLIQEKVSRVDVAIDMADIRVARFQDTFQKGHYVTRGRYSSDYLVDVQLQSYRVGKEGTGFSVGRRPCRLNIYNKVREVLADSEKLSIMQCRRWGSG